MIRVGALSASPAMSPEEERLYRDQCAIAARDALELAVDRMAGARTAIVKAMTCVADDLQTARHLGTTYLALVETEQNTRARWAELQALAAETGRTA